MHNGYGARSLLARCLGLRSERILRRDEIVWGHGWQPPSSNGDIDRVVGESAETSYLHAHTYLVARDDQVETLRSAGVPDAHAIGLPFAWALRYRANETVREANSLLVVPAFHGSYSPDDEHHLDTDYLDFLMGERDRFGKVAVIMNCDDIQLGRHIEWERHGFHVSRGGCENDVLSLERLVMIFSGFETMTTNAFGSPIVYAGAAGCLVSIDGPAPSPENAALWEEEAYRNRPDLKLSLQAWQAETNQLMNDKGLFCSPSEAREITDWARAQIGYENAEATETVHTVLRNSYKKHARVVDSIGLGGVKKGLGRISFSIQLSRATTMPEGIAPPAQIIRNLKSLMSSSVPDELEHLRFGRDERPLLFRPGSSDTKAIHRHFVAHALGALEIGHPRRILDIGAYGGFGALYLATQFPESEIVAVEADPDNFDLLVANFQGNERLSVVNRAAWTTDELTSVLPGTDGQWSNKVIPLAKGYPTVKGASLGELLAGTGWSRADAIFIDIEGAEYEVLRPFDSQIHHMCQVLVVQFHHALARRREQESIVSQILSSSPCHVTETGLYTVFTFQ